MIINKLNIALVLFTSITISNWGYSQEGNYCEISIGATCYEFLEDNRFDFRNYACMHREDGQGRYELFEDSIRFIYEPIEFFRTQFNIKEIASSENIIELQLFISDENNKPLLDEIEVTLYFGKMDYRECSSTLRDSIHLVNIPFDNKIKAIMIGSKNHSTYGFQIETPGIYAIDLKLKYGVQAEEYYMREGTDVYKIELETTDSTEVLKLYSPYSDKNYEIEGLDIDWNAAFEFIKQNE